MKFKEWDEVKIIRGKNKGKTGLIEPGGLSKNGLYCIRLAYGESPCPVEKEKNLRLIKTCEDALRERRKAEKKEKYWQPKLRYLLDSENEEHAQRVAAFTVIIESLDELPAEDLISLSKGGLPRDLVAFAVSHDLLRWAKGELLLVQPKPKR